MRTIRAENRKSFGIVSTVHWSFGLFSLAGNAEETTPILFYTLSAISCSLVLRTIVMMKTISFSSSSFFLFNRLFGGKGQLSSGKELRLHSILSWLGGQEKERDWILGLKIASQALSENDNTDSPLLRVLGTWLMDARTVASTPGWTPVWAFSPNDSGRCRHHAHIITLSAEAWPEAIWAKTGRWHHRLICISEKHFIGIAR